MPKGLRACGHEHCLGECFREGLSERFTSKDDTVRDKVHVCMLVYTCGGVCIVDCVLCLLPAGTVR